MEIDEIRIGQPAALRFSNVNQRTTHEIEGSVIRVSADAVQDERVDQPYFLVRFRFDRGGALAETRLMPGMPVDVFVRTDSRSLISCLTKPLMDQVRHAFREK